MKENLEHDLLGDEFDRMHESVTGLPGYQAKRSTVDSRPWALLPGSVWIVETVRTDDTSAIFLQSVSARGSQRIVIPHKVAETIFRQYQQIMVLRRKVRGQRAAETRKRKLLTEAETITKS